MNITKVVINIRTTLSFIYWLKRESASLKLILKLGDVKIKKMSCKYTHIFNGIARSLKCQLFYRQ